MRDIVLICGPPCAGKTTHAQQYADTHEIVDFDIIAQQLGSPHKYDHTGWIEAAEAEVQARITRIAQDPRARAVVIRALPDPTRRNALAEHVNATRVTVINPGRDICYQRARATHRPPKTYRAIAAWYLRYGPARCDG